MAEGCASRREGVFPVSLTVPTVFADCQWRTWVNDHSSDRPFSRRLTIHSVQLCSSVDLEQRSKGWLMPTWLGAVVPAPLASVRVLFHQGLQPYLDGLGNYLADLSLHRCNTGTGLSLPNFFPSSCCALECTGLDPWVRAAWQCLCIAEMIWDRQRLLPLKPKSLISPQVREVPRVFVICRHSLRNSAVTSTVWFSLPTQMLYKPGSLHQPSLFLATHIRVWPTQSQQAGRVEHLKNPACLQEDHRYAQHKGVAVWLLQPCYS